MYVPCRASGPVTKCHQCHPYSIYTLYEFDRGRNPAAKTFAKIGVCVLKNGEKALLKKSLVQEVEPISVGKADSPMKEVNALFVGVESDIRILGNHLLNEVLEKLATYLLLPYIITANSSAEVAIMQALKQFKNQLLPLIHVICN